MADNTIDYSKMNDILAQMRSDEEKKRKEQEDWMAQQKIRTVDETIRQGLTPEQNAEYGGFEHMFDNLQGQGKEPQKKSANAAQNSVAKLAALAQEKAKEQRMQDQQLRMEIMGAIQGSHGYGHIDPGTGMAPVPKDFLGLRGPNGEIPIGVDTTKLSPAALEYLKKMGGNPGNV